MNNSEIDRNVLISHLNDVRALELLKKKLSGNIEENINKIKRLGYRSVLTKPDIIPRILLSLVCSLFICIFMSFIAGATVFKDTITSTVHKSFISDEYDGFYLSKSIDYDDIEYVIPKNPEFKHFIIIASIITIIIVAIVVAVTVVITAKKYYSYKKAISNDEKRVSNEQKLKEQLTAQNNDYISKLNELNSVLNENYSVNIIPMQFRNLGGICYLYDYLSTSQESLQSALMNYNMNKINLNIQKLASVQSDMLLQQYITNANLRNIQLQNQGIISKLKNIEQNTETAAVYSAMNEANTRTIAFFQSYDFLKN